MNKTCGIYKITNKILEKSYIGKSIHIEDRWKEHIWGKGSSLLHKDFLQYGVENFSFEILEVCNQIDLTEREKYWIAYYDTYHNGYNLNDGGDNSFYAVEKTKKIIYCYDLEGNFIAEYKSMKEAEKETGIPNSNISRAAKTNGRTKTYQWSYIKYDHLPKYQRRYTKPKPITKKVVQLTEDEQIVNIFSSIQEAVNATGISHSGISLVCNGHRKTAGKYKWRFIQEE